jgi:predicted DNA-binding protein with PD1-like motif
MLRLDEGDDLFERLTEFARRHEVRAASVVEGIGMFRRSTVGYWNGREYDPMELAVAHEVVGMHGSIAEVDGAPSLHLHVSLAGPDHRVVGGHLLRATVGVLAEILVISFPGRTFGRALDESLGLRRLDLEPGA